MAQHDPTPHEEFIQRQRDWLAPYATGEWVDEGRAHPEPPHPYRTCFQRDRDRIVHCSAFRRLDYKTQVFVPHEQDHYRTRLTHTLEVAQIGRDLARALRANEDLTEAVALAHDLGHPPFGHAGESALDDLMAQHGHFEHNRQSLRVVDYLEHPYPAFRGLNLTRVVRECLARHTTRYDTPVSTEFDPRLQAPIEGQLVDACDEIAYTCADVEDALQAEWLTRADLDGLELWQRAWRQTQRDAPHVHDIHKQIRATKTLLAILADDLLEATLANLSGKGLDSPQAVRTAPAKCVAFSEATGPALRQMQEFMLKRVYTNDVCLQKDAEAWRYITDLFNLFIARPETLPTRYQARAEADGLQRVACDYIAGMTDRFCIKEHGKLIG
jgi:dGTPase